MIIKLARTETRGNLGEHVDGSKVSGHWKGGSFPIPRAESFENFPRKGVDINKNGWNRSKLPTLGSRSPSTITVFARVVKRVDLDPIA